MAPVTNGESAGAVETKESSHGTFGRSSKKKTGFMARRDSSLSLGAWSKSDHQNGDKLSLAKTPEVTKNVVELLLEGDSSRLLQVYPAYQTVSKLLRSSCFIE